MWDFLTLTKIFDYLLHIICVAVTIKCAFFFHRILIYLFYFVNFSSYGQSLNTTTFIGETIFAILIAILGLVLFAHLIGNMQVLELEKPLYIIAIFVFHSFSCSVTQISCT